MKKQKKKKIRRFYKQSIWPSIVLFLLFIASCVGMVLTFVASFQGYLMDSKIADIHEDARNLGRMIDMHTDNHAAVFDAVAFVKKYLEEENDICITDENDRVLKCFGASEPDFERDKDI